MYSLVIILSSPLKLFVLQPILSQRLCFFYQFSWLNYVEEDIISSWSAQVNIILISRSQLLLLSVMEIIFQMSFMAYFLFVSLTTFPSTFSHCFSLDFIHVFQSLLQSLWCVISFLFFSSSLSLMLSRWQSSLTSEGRTGASHSSSLLHWHTCRVLLLITLTHT